LGDSIAKVGFGNKARIENLKTQRAQRKAAEHAEGGPSGLIVDELM
jgi:hypothetical protein